MARKREERNHESPAVLLLDDITKEVMGDGTGFEIDLSGLPEQRAEPSTSTPVNTPDTNNNEIGPVEILKQQGLDGPDGEIRDLTPLQIKGFQLARSVLNLTIGAMVIAVVMWVILWVRSEPTPPNIHAVNARELIANYKALEEARANALSALTQLYDAVVVKTLLRALTLILTLLFGAHAFHHAVTSLKGKGGASP